MAPILAGPRAPRHHIDQLASVDTSASVREFREVTGGLGLRFPFPGLNDMRAAKRVCVHALITRFLAAARFAHLPRSWGERLVVFVQNEVDRLWNSEVPSLRSARSAAVAAEAAENIAEIEAGAPQPDLDAEDNALAAEESAVTAEIAADRVRLMAITRRRAEIRRQGAA